MELVKPTLAEEGGHPNLFWYNQSQGQGCTYSLLNLFKYSQSQSHGRKTQNSSVSRPSYHVFSVLSFLTCLF